MKVVKVTIPAQEYDVEVFESGDIVVDREGQKYVVREVQITIPSTYYPDVVVFTDSSKYGMSAERFSLVADVNAIFSIEKEVEKEEKKG